MALLKTYKKQPVENLDYDIWYANDPDGAEDWLSSGDILVSVDIDAPEGLTVISLVFPDRVKLWVSAGTTGSTYKVTLTVTTEQGRIKQDELRFRIKDI